MMGIATGASTTEAAPDPGALLDLGAAQMSLVLDARQRAALLAYVVLLAKWNRTFNLTAVREPARMIGLHILDSLAVLPVLDALGSRTLLDLGSGGGLPGIPLAILRPQLRVTMLDAIEKKTAFIRQCSGELGLTNTTVVTQRVDQFNSNERFEAIIARAFAELKDFALAGTPLLADGGRLLAMKGLYPHDEISRLPASYRVEKVVPLAVPQIDGERHLVLLSKADQ